jgi:type IV pilus assembly protein PilW
MEILVGLVIGFIAVLVIYQVYTVSEGYKRNTTALGEAQQTGLYSTFVVGLDLANAGAGMVVESPNLASCIDPGGAMPMRYGKFYRPLPVVVADSGDPNIPDTFVLAYSSATTLNSAAPFTAAAAAGNPFQIQSPGGFHANDLVVAISTPGSPQGVAPCPTSKITAVALTNDNVGDVIITQTPVDPPGGIDLTDAALLLNLGPCNRVQKVMYALKQPPPVDNNPVNWNNLPNCNSGSPCSLYAKPLLDTSAGANCGKPVDLAANPIATNVVNMKVQYGISAPGDPKGTLNTWVPAKATPNNGDWTWTTMMDNAMLVTQINQIRAVRIGIIVQSEQFDKTINSTYTAGNYLNGAYNWVLFDCADVVKANCPGRLTGSIPLQTVPLEGNWRFRTYETVIPLRSAIWQHFF